MRRASSIRRFAVFLRLGLRSVRGDRAFRRILTNSGWLFGASGIGALLSLVQGVLVARALGVRQYGVLATITTFTSAMGQVFDSRSWEMSIKYVTQFHAQRHEIRALSVIKLGYLVDITTALLSFVLTWLLAEWAASTLLSDVAYARAIRICAVPLLFGWSGGTVALLRIFDRFDLLAKINVVVTASRLAGVAFVLYVLHGGLVGVLLVYALSAPVTLAFNLVLLVHMIRRRFHVRLCHARLSSLRGYRRQIGSFLLSTNITALLKIVQTNGAVLALAYWSTPTQAGYYKLAQGFANNLARLYNPLFHTVYPELTRLWMHSKYRDLHVLVKKLLLLPLSIGVPATAFTWAFGATTISFLVGEEYRAAAGALFVLVVTNVVVASTIWFGPFLLACGDAHRRVMATVLGVFFMMVSLIVLVPNFGALGSALAFLSFYAGWGSVAGVTAWQRLQQS